MGCHDGSLRPTSRVKANQTRERERERKRGPTFDPRLSSPKITTAEM